MRIGINCISVDKNYAGGINAFTLGLIGGFASLSSNDSFVIFVNEGNQGLFERWRNINGFRIVAISESLLFARKVLRRSFVFLGQPAVYRAASDLLFADIIGLIDRQCDILYTPTTVLLSYNSKVPNVLSMHDIQQCHFPHFFSWNERQVRKITYPLSARYASHLQASSRFLKRDLIENLADLTEETVTVIPEGVDIDTFSAKADADCLEKYKLPSRFLFFPAQLWPHKNHITVLKALMSLRKKHGLTVPLVLTGADYGEGASIQGFIKEHGLDFVHYLGKVPFKELLALYQSAAFLITAVLYESSSLPILEAAAAGTPVIASATPPNQELGEILQINLFSPESVEELEQLILRLWADQSIGAEQARYNSAHIEHYSWQNAARKYLELFRRLAS